MYLFVWLRSVCLLVCWDFYYIVLWHIAPHQAQPISNFRNFALSLSLSLIFEFQDIPKCRFDFIEDLKALEPPQKFVLRFGYVSQLSYFVPLPTPLAFNSFLENTSFLMKLKVFRAVTVNNTIIWNVLPCSRQESKHNSVRKLMVRYNVRCDFCR